MALRFFVYCVVGYHGTVGGSPWCQGGYRISICGVCSLFYFYYKSPKGGLFIFGELTCVFGPIYFVEIYYLEIQGYFIEFKVCFPQLDRQLVLSLSNGSPNIRPWWLLVIKFSWLCVSRGTLFAIFFESFPKLQ